MTDDLRARVLAAIDEQIKLSDDLKRGAEELGEWWRNISPVRLGWAASLRFARGEVERHGIDTDYPDCYCCETRYPCPSILAAAEAFGVNP